ncbi:MAG: CehA/McbA family metallohydrolase [Parvularculaceae bacterium]
MLFALAGACFAMIGAALAQREPVLKQVTAPHSYYWREMHVPQLTSGPSSLAWSRDGKSLFYSMQGRIWRQRLDAARAEQITAGSGYDYQPDISPDGRSLVFARYDGREIGLVIQDLGSGRESKVTENDAVNIDPRWSPDGARIAYVTTEGTGAFHIAIASRVGGNWMSQRWREERTSKAPRYYYGAVDHELSPSWSPDGKELIFVANPDVIHGSGWIFRQPLDLSAPAALVQKEETNWRTHPDWSPDGKRVLYASYLGRQWHQLWMTAPEDGYPMAFTYGEFDATGARWSPDGMRFAYISNEGGTTAIVVQDVVGGAKTKLAIDARRFKQKMGALALDNRDASGAAIPARVSVRAGDGRDYAPDGAMIHADDYVDAARGGAETHYFHADGTATLSLPAVTAEVAIWRGLETEPERQSVEIAADKTTGVTVSLKPIADNAFANWQSGDVHVHMNYGGHYRMTPERLASQAAAEDLDLVFNLIVNKEQRIPDIGEFSPTPQRIGGVVIAQSQEFHTSVWGHLGLLGLDDHLLISDYAGYPKTGAHSLYPDNAAVADLAHAQGALVGYVHPYDPPAPDPEADAPLKHSLPVDVALGKVDYVEVVGFSDHRTTFEVWSKLLNCGFRLPAAGGSDTMANYASLRGPVGLDRTYVDLGPNPPEDAAAFSRAWLDGLKVGQSFATNGPLLSLEVEGRGPGGEIKLAKGAHKAKVQVRMASIAAVDALEIVVNGKIAATIPLKEEGRAAEYAGEIELSASGWIALRASSEKSSPEVFDLYPFAVTSPIYVTVGGKPARSREDADYFIAWIDRIAEFAKASEDYNTPAEKNAVLDHIARARREFERRR